MVQLHDSYYNKLKGLYIITYVAEFGSFLQVDKYIPLLSFIYVKKIFSSIDHHTDRC